MTTAFLAASQIARQVDRTFWVIGGICIFFLVAITATMLLFVFRYHHKRHAAPAQIPGHLGLEVTWILIPLGLVMFMFFKGQEGFRLIRSMPSGALEVNVIAQSWAWSFEYPEQKIVTERLHLPVGRPVRFNLTSKVDDVNHSFYIPAFRLKEDCVPGKVTHMWLEPDSVGTFNVFCAEFCGRDHAKMIAELEVMEPAAFEQWLEQMVADKNRPVVMAEAALPTSDAIRARDAERLYKTYCTSCHGAGGEGGLVAGARDFTASDGWKNGLTLSGIFRTLAEGLPGTQMRAFPQLSAWDRFALAHKVRAFYKGGTLTADTPEELARLNEEYKLDQARPAAPSLTVEEAMALLAEEAAAAAPAGGRP